MNKKEFLDIFNSCILLKNTSSKYSVYLYYDKNIVRQVKLNRLLNNNNKLSIDLNNINIENILFEYEWYGNINKLYFWVKSDMWKHIQKCIGSSDDDETKKIVQKWINNIKYEPISCNNNWYQEENFRNWSTVKNNKHLEK